jgi:hypothetical protein
MDAAISLCGQSKGSIDAKERLDEMKTAGLCKIIKKHAMQ